MAWLKRIPFASTAPASWSAKMSDFHSVGVAVAANRNRRKTVRSAFSINFDVGPST